jgi:hypothetical protein
MPKPSSKKSAAVSRVPEPDLIRLFIAPLEQAGLDTYMISGSVAAIEYGEPRATLDVDIALAVSVSQVPRLQELYPPPAYYTPPAEVLELEIQRPARGHFTVIHIASGLKADFYPTRSHPLFPWALAHRRRVEISGTGVWLAPPEYVILWKLEFHREGGEEKHLRDIRGMLAVSREEIDQTLLEDTVATLGLQPSWTAVRIPNPNLQS